MCQCRPEVRTPYCGEGDCKWPEDKSGVREETWPHQVSHEVPVEETQIVWPENTKKAIAKEALKLTGYNNIGKPVVTRIVLNDFEMSLAISSFFDAYADLEWIETETVFVRPDFSGE